MARELLLAQGGADSALSCQAILPGRQKVGRSPRCRVYLAHPTVSRVHAEIVRTGDQLLIRDLRSRNGTFVNGQRVREAPLSIGDVLRFGAVETYVIDGPVNQLSTEVFYAGEEAQAEHAGTVYAGENGLTPAQKPIFELLLQGLGEKEIAGDLHLSVHTVHTHVKHIYRAMSVHSRAELLANVLGQGNGGTAPK